MIEVRLVVRAGGASGATSGIYRARAAREPDPDRRQQRSLLLQLEVQAERHLADLIWFALSESHRLSQAPSESIRPDEVSQLMAENLSVLPIFRRGEYVSEREQLVALLCEAT